MTADLVFAAAAAVVCVVAAIVSAIAAIRDRAWSRGRRW